jgi:hypothetical protein
MVRSLAFAALLIALTEAPFAACAQGAPPRAADSLEEDPPQGSGSPPQGGAPSQPAPSQYWGAIGFTADGSWSTAWKMASKAEAEAQVAIGCSKFGRGKCEVVSFSGEFCVGLATFNGVSGRRRWQLSFTAGGKTTPEAQQAALDRCNTDQRARNRCQLRTVVCGDGR